MKRGEVYTLANHTFPDGTTKSKHAVFLVGNQVKGVPGNGQVSVVLANTDRRKIPKRAPYPYEVELGTAEGFDHETLVDGRWVPVKTWDEMQGASYKLTLDDATMKRVDRAIYEGLKLDP